MDATEARVTQAREALDSKYTFKNHYCSVDLISLSKTHLPLSIDCESQILTPSSLLRRLGVAAVHEISKILKTGLDREVRGSCMLPTYWHFRLLLAPYSPGILLDIHWNLI